jgi:hypothetical protein
VARHHSAYRRNDHIDEEEHNHHILPPGLAIRSFRHTTTHKRTYFNNCRCSFHTHPLHTYLRVLKNGNEFKHRLHTNTYRAFDYTHGLYTSHIRIIQNAILRRSETRLLSRNTTR